MILDIGHIRTEARLDFAGVSVVLRRAGSLFLPALDLLVIADLHLGKGLMAAGQGRLVPPQADAQTIDAVVRERAQCGASRLALLGDTFHAPALPGRGFDVAASMTALGGNVTLVLGNHDDRLAPLLGESCRMVPVGADVLLTHEPIDADKAQIVGHFHPCITLATRAGRQRRRCFVITPNLLILPAFGALTGGLDVTAAPLASLAPRARIAVI